MTKYNRQSKWSICGLPLVQSGQPNIHILLTFNCKVLTNSQISFTGLEIVSRGDIESNKPNQKSN